MSTAPLLLAQVVQGTRMPVGLKILPSTAYPDLSGATVSVEVYVNGVDVFSSQGWSFTVDTPAGAVGAPVLAHLDPPASAPYPVASARQPDGSWTNTIGVRPMVTLAGSSYALPWARGELVITSRTKGP